MSKFGKESSSCLFNTTTACVFAAAWKPTEEDEIFVLSAAGIEEL